MGFDHCKNWNGRHMLTGSECKCKAGVDPIYSFAGGERFGWVKKVPCLRPNEADAICPASDFPTKEEAEREEVMLKAAMDKFVKNVTVVRPAIIAQHKETGKWSGEIECPECSKRLRWTIAKSNNHVHAACETEGSISWIE